MKPALFIVVLVFAVAAAVGLYASGPKTKKTNTPCVASRSDSGAGGRSKSLPLCSYRRTTAFERIKGGITDLHHQQDHRRR
jgi:hypothetical protein